MKTVDISKMSLVPDSLQVALNAIKDSPTWTALQEIQAMINDLPLAQIQKEIEQAYQMQPYVEYALSIQRQIEATYGPLRDITKSITDMAAEWSVALQETKALQAIPHYNFDQLFKMARTAQIYLDDMQPLISDVSEEDLQEYRENGEVTPETVAEAVETISKEASQERITIPDRLGKVQRTNWFFALTIIWAILSFLGKPVIDHLEDSVLQATGITQMWEDSGIYDWMNRLFNITEAVSESEAKAAIDDAATGNIAKAKREELLKKIGAIRAYIAAAPQDENTGNLLTYLSELENDVNGKKYGLVFEEHREAIDEILETHTPVLIEEPDLLLDRGGQMNFLLEGDNLAALRLLEKTHRGRIDLIYIDPPYNTGNRDFVYDDCFVDAQDTFRHSKWLSFMSKRLEIAKHLLSENGVIFISIDDREQAGLKLLCDSVFDESCFVADVSWQRTYSKRNDSKGIPAEVEHILVYSSKPSWIPHRLPRTEEMNEKYGSQDGDLREWSSVTVNAPGAATHQGMVYAIQHPITGELLYPPTGRCWAFGQQQMFEYMSEWAEYQLKPLNDYDKRHAICEQAEGVPQSIDAILLTEPIPEALQKAIRRYEQGLKKEKPWPMLYFTANGRGGIRRKQYLDTRIQRRYSG